MSASDELQRFYHEQTLSVTDWTKAGGRAIGHTGRPCPVELIAAAGFLPVRLRGAQPGTGEAFRKYAIATHPMWSTGVNQIRLGYVNAMSESLLNGTYSGLDRIVVTNPRKSVFIIHTIVTVSKELEPALPMPDSHFVDHTIVASYDSSRFHRKIFLDFKETLEDWSGTKITEEAMADRIAKSNETRELIAKLWTYRAEENPRLSGTLALAAVGAAQVLPSEKANALLNDLLIEVEGMAPRTGPRVVILGSPLDNDVLYREIEATGATVVDETHSWGAAGLGPAIRSDISPFEAASDQFHHQRPDVHYPLFDAVAATKDQVTAANPDLAVFHVYDADDPQAWQTPTEMNALKDAGVETLYLHGTSYDTSEMGAAYDKIASALATKTRSMEAAK